MQKQFQIMDSTNAKALKSDAYNFIFDKNTGFFARWGQTKDDDPSFSVIGPEICDIELSEICSGVGTVCKFCYKSNTPKGKNMSLETFKKVAEHFPPTMTQLALGIGDIDAHPELWDICDYIRSKGWVPNVTINGSRLTDELVDKVVGTFGAVAVSLYDKDTTYNAIDRLTNAGLKQCNMHVFISEETYDKALGAIQDAPSDPRLKNLKAIVFLSLKKKGRAERGFTPLAKEKFENLIKVAVEKNVGIGFDSCSAHRYLRAIENIPKLAGTENFVEDCESTRFSMYVNVDGKFFPCSFTEGEETAPGGWKDGIDMTTMNNFQKDLWFDEKTMAFRNAVIKCNEDQCNCCHFNIEEK